MASTSLVLMLGYGVIFMTLFVIGMLFWWSRNKSYSNQEHIDLKDFFDKAPCGYHALDPNGLVLEMNQTELTWLGYSREEVVHRKNLTDLVTNASKAVLATYFKTFHATGRLDNLQVEFLRKDGTSYSAIVYATAILDSHGNFLRSRTVVYPDSGSLKIESQFLGLIDSLPDTVIIVNQAGLVALSNAESERAFGYTRSELTGRPVTVLIPDLKNINDSTQSMQDLYAKRKDGSVFPVEISLNPRIVGQEYLVFATVRDITLRKEAEQHTQFLATIANNIQDPIFATDNDFKIIRWNQAAEDLFGWKEREVLGKTALSVLKIIYPNGSREEILKSYRSKGFWQGELIYHTFSGVTLNVWVTSGTLKDSRGQITGSLVLIRDITRQKKNEQQIALLASMVENTNDAMYSVDRDFQVLTWNRASEETYGFKRDEVIGRSVYDIIRSTMTKEQRAEIRSKIVSFNNWHDEIEHFTKAGKLINVLAATSAIRNEAGEVFAYVSTARDITERKEIEKQLQFLAAITNSIEDVVMVTDTNFIITKWNSAAERILGWRESEVIGKPADILQINNLNATRDSIVAEVADKGFWTGEAIIPTKAGETGYYTATYCPLMGEKSMPTGYLILARDITPLKAAEAALHELNNELEDRVKQRSAELVKSEAFNRGLFNSLHAQIAVIDEQGVIVSVNKNWEQFAKSNGLNDLSSVSPGVNYLEVCRRAEAEGDDLAGEVATGLEAVISGRQATFEIEYPCHSPQEQRWFSMRANQMGHEQSKVVIAHSEITQRKLTELRIVESEERFRSIYATSSDAILQTKPDGTILAANAAACEMFGWSEAELLKLGRKGLIFEDDDRVVAGLNERDRTGQIHSIWRHKRKDGAPFWGEVSSSLFTTSDGELRASVFIRDITERLIMQKLLTEKEQQLQLFVKYSPAAMAMFDDKMRYIMTSDRYLSVYGMDRKLTGRSHYDVFPEITQEWRDVHARCLAGASEKKDEEVFYRADGSISWMKWEIVPWYRSSGQVGGIILMSEDITARKQIEDQIKQLNESLEQKVELRTEQLSMVNKELEAFSYSVSHDLRAPLRAISGYAEILVEDYKGKLDAEGQRVIDTIVRNTNRMGRLIDDMLNFSRLGRLNVSQAHINMEDVVHKVVADLTQTADTKAKITVKELLPAQADLDMITQVWTNYIGNAIKYSSKQASPKIEIGSYREDERIVYYVKDNGAGFDNQFAGKLFGVFQRLHGQSEFSGTGVGLAIVKRIVEKHNGSVWGIGDPGKGATFYFSLPLTPIV